MLPTPATAASAAADSPLTAAPSPQAGAVALPEFFLKLFEAMLGAEVDDDTAASGKPEDQREDQPEGKAEEGFPLVAVVAAMLPPSLIDAAGTRAAATPAAECADPAVAAVPAANSEPGPAPAPMAALPSLANGTSSPVSAPPLPISSTPSDPASRAVPNPTAESLEKPGTIPAPPLPLHSSTPSIDTGVTPGTAGSAPSREDAWAPAPAAPPADGRERSRVARVDSIATAAFAPEPGPSRGPAARVAEAPEDPARTAGLAFLARLTPLEDQPGLQAASLPSPAPARPANPLQASPSASPAAPLPGAPPSLSGNPLPSQSPLPDTPAGPVSPASAGSPQAEPPALSKPNPAARHRAPEAVFPVPAPAQAEKGRSSAQSPAGQETGSPIPWPAAPVHRESAAQSSQPAAPPAPPRGETPAPPPPAAAREIRLQVSGQEHRVDVRLTERAGEVQVAVRTPDSRLAGVLREDLPALAARLEQTGFRAETWHPGLAPETRGLSVTETRMAEGSGQEPGGHGQPPPQQDRRQPQEQARGETPPQEFAWLLSSLP